MSVRSRAALLEAPAPVSKGFGTGIPPAIEAAEARSQMTPASPFSPGEPIGPYDGFSRTPRSHDYVTGYNIATRPRIHERVAFETLKGLFASYDVARICVRHRIASLRSLDYKLVSAEGYEGDISADVREGKRVLKRPDRKTLFKPWLAKYLRGVLTYDAGTLYRMRNRAGRPIGLSVVDGTLIAPLQDYWGNPPDDPAPAYVQYVNGLPWNWLTRSDLIYEPYDPQDDSLYGTAPLEDILLNANTDIRFQLYFLQRFTEGNLPAAFASAPDSWSPGQIEQFQEYWDAFMLGDQSRKHQIRWLPPTSKIAWSNEKDFSDVFSQFLMRKTCSAYSVVPADLGFTETVNKSSGESQADVQHRVGDLPMAMHIQDILTAFLQEDLQLPLKFAFDLGEEQDDRVNQAQADKVYFDMGAVGSSEIRELRYGWSDPVPIPRTIMTSRGGPVPIASLLALAGEIDPATSLPALGAALPKDVFGGVEGTLPEPPIKVTPLAEREYGPSAMPPAPPPQPQLQDSGAIAKEGEGGAPPAGITAATGLYSYDLDGGDDEPGSLPVPSPLRDEGTAAVAKEMQAFRRYSRARRRSGEWRDFEFRTVAKVAGHNLNDAGRLAVRKDAGEVAVAGLAVLAADTGRVLMLQRALDPDDPAAGKIEFPGGHLEGTETPLRGAWREWAEETGAVPPPGVFTGAWTSPDGIYQGIVWTTDSEASVPVRGGAVVPNPDADPDGDQAEAILWLDPADLPGNPLVRSELAACMGDVLAALGCAPDAGEAEAEEVAKAGDARPKWHGWTLDRKTAAHWAPKVRDSVKGAIPRARAREIGRDYLADHPEQDGKAPGKRDRNKAAAAWLLAWLARQGIALVPEGTAEAIVVDGYAIGAVSAAHQVTGQPPGGQKPGDTDSALDRIGEAGLIAALALLLRGGNGTAPAAEAAAERIVSGYAGALAIILAGTDADWADSQETLDELGDLLSDALAGEDLAVTLVGTEIGIFTGLSAQAYYLANSVAWVSWQTMDDGRECAICLENEAAGPVLMGQEFPSGHTAPPVHPKCAQRCAIIPSAPPGA
jgi:8-oxo-dGTP pyrophosphatase MutT (NUDIX family)